MVSIVIDTMTGRELVKHLKKMGCEKLRQRGSHVQMKCFGCQTTIPLHGNEQIGKGLLAQIERDLAACLGEKWMKEIK